MKDGVKVDCCPPTVSVTMSAASLSARVTYGGVLEKSNSSFYDGVVHMVVQKFCVVCETPLSTSHGLPNSQLCNSPICKFNYRNYLTANRPSCKACGRVMQISRTVPGFFSICSKTECQALSPSIRSQHASFCVICGVFIRTQIAGVARHVCASPFCQEWDSNNRAAELQTKRAISFQKRRSELESLAREQALDLLPVLRQDSSLTTIVLPFLEHNLKPSSSERRQRVEAGFLEIALAAYASKEETDTFESTPDLAQTEHSDTQEHLPLSSNNDRLEKRFTRLNGSACSTCGGRCCNLGGDRAFLSIEQFREIFRSRPDTTPIAVVAEYMARIPDESFENSCIFHGIQGCNLAREQRSIICNRYLCGSLELLREHVNQGASKFILAATNLRDEDDPKLMVLRIKIADDHDERILQSAASDKCDG